MSSKMARQTSQTEILKDESSVVRTNSNPPTKYKNMHCSQSCMKLYLQEETADVHFVFETGDVQKRVPAHKFILGIGSPVFHSMFYGSLQEKGDIRIMDTTIDAFKQFLQFFYLENVVVEMEYVEEMMYLANKYDIPECFNVCETFLKEKLPIDNICHILQLAVTFDRSELVAFLLAKISEKPKEIFASSSFTNCAWGILQLILESDTLLCDEKEVFDACMVWSKKACEKKNLDPLEMKNRREQLGDCFHLIQFDVMKPPHISECLSKYKDLFTRDELVDIIAILSSDNSINFRDFNRKRVPRNKRQWNDNAILIFSCTDYEEKTYYITQSEETAFETNKKLLLGAVATPPINPRSRDKTELSGVMKIIECTSNEILLKQHVILALGGKFEPRNIIKLGKPIDVEPNVLYEIRIEFDSTWSEKIYDTKKIKLFQSQSIGDCRVIFGEFGIVSHLYFN